MNIRRFLKWSLVLMAFLAYKQLEGESTDAERGTVYSSQTLSK